MWLVSHIILKDRWRNSIFWVVAVFSWLAFAAGHTPSVMILFGLRKFGDIPAALLGEIILINGVLSLFAACYFRRYGFLAEVGVHFWADIVWHVIRGAV